MARPAAVEDAILTKYEKVLQLDKAGWEYDGAANYIFSELDAFGVVEAGIHALGAGKVRVLDMGCGGGGFLKQLHKRCPDLGGFVGLTGDTYGSLCETADHKYPWIAFDPLYFEDFPEPHKDRYKVLYEECLGDTSKAAAEPEFADHCFMYGVPIEQLGFFIDPERFFRGARFDFIFVSWTFVHMVDPVGMLSTLYKLLRPSSGVLLGNTFVPVFEQSNSFVPLLEWIWRLRSEGMQVCFEDESVFVVHNGKAGCAMSGLGYGSIVEKVWRTVLVEQQRLVVSYDIVPGKDLTAARRLMHEDNSVANVIVDRFPVLSSDARLALPKSGVIN